MSRITFVISLVLYLVTLGIYYLSSDILTQTHYHKRSVLPFLNQAVGHEDLLYSYNTNEKRGGDLRMTWIKDETLFLSRYLRGDSKIQAERMVKAISDIPIVNLVKRDEG